MKNTKYLLIFIILSVIFTSCSSVYISPEESLDNSDVDLEGEYFTKGSIYSNGGFSATGFIYKGCWLYIETQTTIAPTGERNGKIFYGEAPISRVVKYNPVTDTVSSPCLDPVCTHSYESGCVMIEPFDAFGEHATLVLVQLVGDWMIMLTQYNDNAYITRNYPIFYNLQTGEARRFFEEDLESEIVTRWASGCSFGNVFYNIKQTFDLSETSFDSSGNKSMYDYSPKTIQILCEHDLDSGKTTELFEIPETYLLIAVSNKRFFFVDDANAFYSCNRDGSNMAKEDQFDFIPEDMVGSYAYEFYEQNGFNVYDVNTNQKRSVTVEYEEYNDCFLADDGVLFDYVGGLEKYREIQSTRTQFYAEHEGMDKQEIARLFSDKLAEAKHSGPARIYKCDFDGENMRLIYEEENAVITSLYATEEYLFALRSKYIDGGSVSGRCIINLKTGEIKKPPLLEVIVPSWYVND